MGFLSLGDGHGSVSANSPQSGGETGGQKAFEKQYSSSLFGQWILKCYCLSIWGFRKATLYKQQDKKKTLINIFVEGGLILAVSGFPVAYGL